MSVIKRIIKDSIERLKVDELLGKEFDQAGYGGITLTKTPLGAQINLYTMRPGRVIGKRGRAIKAASERLEYDLGIPNPQITVVEVEIPELNPRIMASRIASALERGVHFRRALFWALRRIMESGALGCEIVLRGKLRSNRSRFEKVSDGYVPKSGDPAIKNLRSATMHVKLKKGTFGVNVTIVPPESKFPDKISLEGLPEVEVPEEEAGLPEGVEPEAVELPAETVVEETRAVETETPHETEVEKLQEEAEKPESIEETRAETTPEPIKTLETVDEETTEVEVEKTTDKPASETEKTSAQEKEESAEADAHPSRGAGAEEG